MADDYLRTHVIDGSHWCTQDRGKTDIDSQPRIRTICAVCCRPAPGGICDMHPGMASHDVARIIALRAANSRLVRELHRWQTGTQIEGDYLQCWISRSDFEELEKHAADLERQVLDVTAERDRLRKGFADATAKHRVYRREIRRLQRAFMAERGQGLTDEVQRIGRVLSGFQARLEALEGEGT